MKRLLLTLCIAILAAAMPAALFIAGEKSGQRSGQAAAQAQCAADTQAAADIARDEADRARQAELDTRQEIHDDALQMQRRAVADGADAVRSRIGLQQRAHATAVAIGTRACAPVAAEPAGPPASAAELVLTDVLSWADGRADEAAAAADAAHAAGITCEREHDAAVSAPGTYAP